MNKLRIAPSQHRKTIHVLINQYINRCYQWEETFKELGITPYMDLSKKNTGFHKKEDIHFKENVWNRWFVQPELSPDELWWAEDTTEGGVSSGMNSPIENIHLCHNILKKYLIIQPFIIDKVNDFVNNNFKGKVLGIHVRGSDCYIDNLRPKIPLAYFRDIISEYLYYYDTIFIATDTLEYRNYFINHFPDKVVFYDSKSIVSFDSDYDFFSIHEKNVSGTNGEDVIIESLILSKTDFLLRNRSNIAHFAQIVNPNLESHQLDLPFLMRDYYQSIEINPRYYNKQLEVKKHDYYWEQTSLFTKEHQNILNNHILSNIDEMKKIINKYLIYS
jgi:hypothetical protein